jgi:D-3-phosphoglycerate dehydrogenase
MTDLAGTKVLIGPSSFAELDETPVNRLVEAGCEIIGNPFGRRLTRDELTTLLNGGAVGLIAGLEPLDREVLQKSRLKVISRCGSGLSNVDLAAARELAIEVCSTPSVPTVAVAELTLAAMLSLLRLLPQMDRDLHEKRWTKKIGHQLEGKTVAIVGFGRIGRRVAALLAPFDAHVLAVDPYLEPAADLPLVSLEEALPRADILTLHCSGDFCLLGERELALLKPGAFVLNAARGGLVDEAALLKALGTGRIAGAWLDAFEQEPYDGPLASCPNVLLTPHVGSYTRECRARMEAEAVDNLIAALLRLRNR